MDVHYIVMNSYSCGIGEQNQIALMMGNGNQAKCSKIFLLYNFRNYNYEKNKLCRRRSSSIGTIDG